MCLLIIILKLFANCTNRLIRILYFYVYLLDLETHIVKCKCLNIELLLN